MFNLFPKSWLYFLTQTKMAAGIFVLHTYKILLSFTLAYPNENSKHKCYLSQTWISKYSHNLRNW